MGNPVADKTQTQTLQPLIINPKTVDNYHDAGVLPLTSLSQADNIILDDGIIEKVPGTTKISAGTLSAAGVMGLHRTYSPAGTKMALKLYNGTLYSIASPSSTSKFATTVLANLATNKRTPWVDVRGKAYGINETDGIIRYDANTATGVKTGIVGPFLRKKIAFFEDDETWSTTVGGSQVTTVNRPEEWTGKAIQSLKLYCSAVSTTAYSQATIPLDLSQYSDGKATGDEDLLSLYTFHGSRRNLSSVSIILATKATTLGNSLVARLDQSHFESGDHEWTKWNIKKGSFSTLSGTPDWSKISAVRIIAKSNTLGTTSVHFDYMYMKPSPVKAFEMRKNVFNCENTSNETWTFKASQGELNYKQSHDGIRSVRLNGTVGGAAASATCALGTQVDLTKWGNGASTDTSDEFVFHIRTTDTTMFNSTNPLILRVGNNSSNYLIRTFANLSAQVGLTGNDQWVQVRVPKARISAAGAGSVNWATIDYVSFITSALTGATKYVWIDDCYFEQKIDVVQIADFESDETWTVTGKGEQVKDPIGKGKVTEGEQCLKLWASTVGEFTQSYAVRDFGASDIDLTAWSDGGNSDTSDVICFSLFHQLAKKIEWVEIWFDNGDAATFATAYKYRVTKDMFAGAGVEDSVGKEIQIAKSDFEAVGATGAWSTIGAIKFIVSSKGDHTNGSVFIDNLQMRRKSGITGRYYYKYIFKVGDVASAASEDSEYIDVKGAAVSLVNLSTSQDSRVTSREIYRLGGTYTDTWGLVKIIEDNTTTSVIDDVNDSDITYFMGDEVPQGWINSVLCNNLVYDPYSDRVYYWGDPTYKNRVWFSHIGFYHVVDEWGYRDFPDDVQAVVPWFGQNIIFYRNSIQKVVDGDITTGQLINVTSNAGACSYWAVGRPWNGQIPFVGWDNVYMFDGIRSTPIGEEIKGYFKGRETYLSTVNVAVHKDCLYIACKEKSGTPTYNDVVLRCYLPTKSWTILPDWNVNVWCNFDKQDDLNDLYFGASDTGQVYYLNPSSYQFGTSNIAIDYDTGWLSFPDSDIVIDRIEFKAKGTASSTLTFKGYINLGSTASTQGTVTLTANWQIFRLGPKGIMDLLKGNCVKIEFTQSSQNAWFKMKDIVIYASRLAERVSMTTANEVSCAAP